MAKILVFLDERSFYMTEMTGTAAAALQAINSGEAPEGILLPEGRKRESLSAFQYGELVVAVLKDSPNPPSSASLLLPEGSLPKLTPRELQVLQLLTEGLTVKQIAARLGVTSRTIRYFVNSLNEKFGTRSTEQSVGKGVLMGLCRLPS